MCVFFFFSLFKRQILKDLSSEDTEDRREDEGTTVAQMSAATTIYQTSSGQYGEI